MAFKVSARERADDGQSIYGATVKLLTTPFTAGLALFHSVTTSNGPKDPDGTISRGTSSREEQMSIIARLVRRRAPQRLLTDEDELWLQKLRASAEHWSQNEGAEILAQASNPNVEEPGSEEDKMTPEEVGLALSGKIVGRAPKSYP
jgi:hypothetical protein